MKAGKIINMLNNIAINLSLGEWRIEQTTDVNTRDNHKRSQKV